MSGEVNAHPESPPQIIVRLPPVQTPTAHSATAPSPHDPVEITQRGGFSPRFRIV
jgi:hypothetical protein